jgi:hypothetical protein
MKIEITAAPDGTYSVQQSGDEPDAGQNPQEQAEMQPQVAQSVDEVLQLVQQMLTEQGGGDPQQMWDQEAQKRQQPAAGDSGTQGGPSMTMGGGQ